MSGCNQYLNFEGTKNLWVFLSRWARLGRALWRDGNMHMKTIRFGSNNCALQLYPAAKVMKINFDVETLKRASVCWDSLIKLLSIPFAVVLIVEAKMSNRICLKVIISIFQKANKNYRKSANWFYSNLRKMVPKRHTRKNVGYERRSCVYRHWIKFQIAGSFYH